jgi:hypothetical protein
MDAVIFGIRRIGGGASDDVAINRFVSVVSGVGFHLQGETDFIRSVIIKNKVAIGVIKIFVVAIGFKMDPRCFAA